MSSKDFNNLVIAIKMRKVNISGFFLFVPDSIMFGKYMSSENFFEEKYTKVSYYNIKDDYLQYSEEEYGFFHPIKYRDFINVWKKEDISFEEAINNYYDFYSTKPFITGYLDTNREEKVSKTIDLDTFFTEEKDGKSFSSTNKVIAFNSMTDDEYNYILNKIQDLTSEKSEEFLNNIYRSITKPYERYKALNDILEEKLESFDERDAEVVIKEIVEDELNEGKDLSKEKKSMIIERLTSKKEADEYIKSIVIGQDEHVERITTEMLKLELKEEIDDKKTGILLTGSTGVGKTKIISLLAKKYDRAFLLIDTTQLSMPGYVGRNIEDFLLDLYVSEKGNLERVENAIIVFDEIDKKGSSSNYDVSGRGVLNTLLKFTDGTYYTLSNNKKISTDKMTVIVAGAFSSVYKSPLLKKGKLGFDLEDENLKDRGITVDDFIEKGGMPDEFMGRFPVFIRLNNLLEKDLKNILINSKESPLLEQKKLFEMLGVSLIMEDSYIDAVAHKAFEKNTGARSLPSIVEESNWKAVSNIVDHYGTYSSVKLTKDTVEDNNNYILVPKEKEEDLPKVYELKK